ncbi:MAG: SUMF1/EgtB/PvdO family nonheme iron enzyme [Blastocatellia bacterium]|nr:SUMF1/EgtB/PvdO family nonheme iron enzyme [Blastocatellia bacterium]
MNRELPIQPTPPLDGDKYVFLSYARDDQAVAERVEAALTAAGIRVFRDRSDIHPGDNWDLKIEQALRECQSMVLLLSPTSMPERKEVHREWFRFDQKGKTIYPLYLRDCELHSRFDSRNYIDARTDLEGALEQLLRALGSPSAASGDDPLTRYRRERIKAWSLPRYELDKRFVNLTLLLDRGEDNPQRWQADDFRFDDLRKVLEKTAQDPALVLLGAPGSGKSTLLRRLQLDHSEDRLADGGEEITFFLQLNEYHGEQSPRDWLLTCWRERHPELPPLETWLQKGRALLLLDALNEMQPPAGSGHRELIAAWKEFTQKVCRQGNRVLFSCRSLDYSASLSSRDLPVPQIQVQPMTEEQVLGFLKVYAPAQEPRIWAELKGSPQFTLFQTPYFLKLLCDQVEASGELPKGRAGLFTGFVRKALAREIDGDGDLFRDAALLDERDHRKLSQSKWADAFDLPENGLLLPRLSHLAFTMQENGMRSEGAQVRVGYAQACEMLADPDAKRILKAGLALTVLDEQIARDEITFFHQLLQEYFAARRLAKTPNPALVRVEWTKEKARPPLEETLAGLADGDPLPPLPQTGWEETTLTAAPMSREPEAFIRALLPHNLPLAARCAASPELQIGETLRREIQQALLASTQDPLTDLRARIAAGEALGLLGDPRFEKRSGPHGDYLLPPLIEIPGGTYPMGDKNGLYDREKPPCKVKLAPFQVGQFPVTNAEYKLFMDAGGYEREEWWDTDESKAWLRGEASTDGQKESWRDNRKTLQGWSEDHIRGLVTQNRITSEQADDWLETRNWTDEEFEQWLDETFPSGKLYRQPEFWDDARFNNPSQPVVGVTWFEARAYCNWLTANDAASSRLFRLPTEAEFEAAARGTKGRIYPYGKAFDVSRCNTFESHIRRTTPVGIFDNATPEGIFDLSGNAYTWTLSIFDQDRYPYPYRPDDGREDFSQTGVKRVLRGGSFAYDDVGARAVFRDRNQAAIRFINYGFRLFCVLRPPSPSDHF